MKKTKLTKIPILVQLYPKDVYSANLNEQLKIDRHRIDRELLRQPILYGFWSELYAIVSAKVAFLEEQRDHLESKLFKRYHIDKGIKRVTDVKYFINGNPRYQRLKKKIRRWKDSERQLKYAERAFVQRLTVMMAFNANRRAQKKSEDFREEED